MPTEIQPVPDAVLASEFPSLADRAANTYNTKAKAWADSENAMVTRTREIALTAQNNATVATEQAVIATNKAGEASSSAQAAANSADAAAQSATNAQGSATAAAGYVTEAEQLMERYQGALAADPTLNKDGGPLVAGDWYINTVSATLRAYDGAAWQQGISAVAGVSSINGMTGAVTFSPISIEGDTQTYVTLQETYTITNYNSFSDYVVQVSDGTVSLAGDTITFNAPSSPQTVTLTVTVDGQSEAFSIGVTVAPPDYIATPAATPSNFGDAFEGGFYAGMVWNQLVQSSTSTVIGTGTKTFTVPDMAANPIVYGGQELEIRSRANPSNKMVGTVTGAAGTTLTVNVTSVGGSGTFSDWSIMSRYRLIVAPKSSGENAGIAIKNAASALPTACQTLTEGWLATEAMKNADTSTVYPAAHWARGLSIGGFDDWFIPARDQLELCWRNLKPTTDNNYTTVDRPTAAAYNYANLGSYGDTSAEHGVNNNSAPTGSAYTASVPGRTAVAAFQTGGAEAFEYGSAYYWSSSDYDASYAWRQAWNSGPPGAQSNSLKTNTYRVRAVRRSII